MSVGRALSAHLGQGLAFLFPQLVRASAHKLVEKGPPLRLVRNGLIPSQSQGGSKHMLDVGANHRVKRAYCDGSQPP
eukprot:8910547-Pyramimonas_sp.AAC.2